MLEILAHRPRGQAPWSDEPIVYVLTGHSEQLDSLVAKTGARTVNVQAEMPPPHGFVSQLQWLRNHAAGAGVSHLVWVSAPSTAEFAMSMRLAPVQTFWTLKFHPFQIPEIDGYISYGAWSEEERIVHGERWKVVPFVLSKPSPTVAAADVIEARRPFAHYDVLFGTLARTEKMNSRAFLDAVVQILRNNPGGAFLWTGQEPHAGIQAVFQAGGVTERCHFIGWVQTPVYVRALDIFLESFPFGCGLTGIQALEASTAFLSYQAPETLFGMHFMRPLTRNDAAAAEIHALLDPPDGAAPLQYARDSNEYVILADRLARDRDFRSAVGVAGNAYYRRYLTDSDRMSRRFMQILAETDCRRK
jgi:predicted O-linked N-acetylglucosamine transferase (SPINDLY family)